MAPETDAFPHNADFPEALAWVMAREGVSFRRLAALTRAQDPAGKGLHYAFLSDVVRRKETASPRSIELVARALGLQPCKFAEYRLAVVRRAFDDRELGLDGALQNARTLRTWLVAGEGSALARELARVLDCPDDSGSAVTELLGPLLAGEAD
jgi:hypothetical protein